MTVIGWTKRYLGELVTVQGGFAFRSEDFVDDGVPIVRMSDLDDGTLDLQGAARIEETKLKRLSNFALKGGDFLVGMSGSIGNYAIVHKKDLPAYLNQRVGRFRLANHKLADYGFITQVARSDPYKLHVESLAAGAAQVNISPTQIESFCFDAPPEPEQIKIAEVLSTVDRAIEQTEALIAKQQRIKTGLMQDLLTRGIDEHGNLRSEETHQFKDSPLGRIPVEWELKPIGRVFKIQLGKMLSKQAKVGRSPFPYLGNKNVQWDDVDLHNLEWMDFSEQERKKFCLEPGDIIVCEGGEVGRTCLWRGELENCFYQKAIHRLRPFDGYLPGLFPRFMRWMTQRGMLSDFTSQTSIAHLTKEKLSTVPLLVPPADEQQCICDAADAFDEGLSALETQLRKLEHIKAALMQDLLTGKVRVTPLLPELREAGA